MTEYHQESTTFVFIATAAVDSYIATQCILRIIGCISPIISVVHCDAAHISVSSQPFTVDRRTATRPQDSPRFFILGDPIVRRESSSGGLAEDDIEKTVYRARTGSAQMVPH